MNAAAEIGLRGAWSSAFLHPNAHSARSMVMARERFERLSEIACATAILASLLVPVQALGDVVVAVGCPNTDDWAIDRSATEAEATERALRTCNASANASAGLDNCCTLISVVHEGCLAIALGGGGWKATGAGSSKANALSTAVSACVRATGRNCLAEDAECAE